jgi:hypothetical protein
MSSTTHSQESPLVGFIFIIALMQKMLAAMFYFSAGFVRQKGGRRSHFSFNKRCNFCPLFLPTKQAQVRVRSFLSHQNFIALNLMKRK